MRHTARALVIVIILAGCASSAAAAETGSRWWPFGHHDDEKVSQPSAVATPGTSSGQYPSRALTQPLPAPTTGPLAHEAQFPSTTADADKKEHWMLNSKKGKVGWPHLTKPKTGLLAEKPKADATRNSWVEKTPEPPKPSPFKPITDGAHKVATGTKKAWHKTVDAVTPGEPTPAPRTSGSSRIAKRDTPQPSIWKRMFSSEPEPKQSQTVPGFIAQQRVDSQSTQKR